MRLHLSTSINFTDKRFSSVFWHGPHFLDFMIVASRCKSRIWRKGLILEGEADTYEVQSDCTAGNREFGILNMGDRSLTGVPYKMKANFSGA